jgi:hypothetical protein
MDEPDLNARHLLVCRDVIYEPDFVWAAHTLRGLVVSLRPGDDDGYPVIAEHLWLFAQVYGTPGEYEVWVELVRIDPETDEGIFVARYGPSRLTVSVGRFVDNKGWRLPKIPFDVPGVYEFRLYVEGRGDPLAAERLRLENP